MVDLPKKKYNIVISHMHTTHWPVMAEDKVEAELEIKKLVKSMRYDKPSNTYYSDDYECVLRTLPDVAVMAVEPPDSRKDPERGTTNEPIK